RTRKIFFRMTGVHIGEGTNVTPGLIVNDGYSGLCSIGNRVSIATNVTLVADSNPNNSRLGAEPYVKDHLVKQGPVVIEDDVWLGTNVVVLPGVRVGRGAVVGAGAVVSRDIPPFSVATGNPARVSEGRRNRELEYLPVGSLASYRAWRGIAVRAVVAGSNHSAGPISGENSGPSGNSEAQSPNRI